MKYNFTILLLLFLVVTELYSTTYLFQHNLDLDSYYDLKEKTEKWYQAHKAFRKNNGYQAGDSLNTYDIKKYDITLDWYTILSEGEALTENNKFWDGRVIMDIEVIADVITYIPLDAVDLSILSVFVNGVQITPTPGIVNDVLIIPLNSNPTKGVLLNVDINYRYTTFDNMGFYFYAQDTSSRIYQNIAYTVNSPEFARFWFPCNDTPGDKAALSMNVTVPQGYTVASNGMLDSITEIIAEPDGYSALTYHWSDTTPIATFLINAVASIFEEYIEKFSPNPDSDEPDSLDINYYVWEEEILYRDLKYRLRRTPNMLEFFSKTYNDYAFCKYGSVVFSPFPFGAMENQTITNLNSVIFNSNYSYERTMAHEIAHHWFGDLVSSKNWNDIWFKEGGATWSEAMWELSRSDADTLTTAYYSVMNSKRSNYLANPDIYDVPIWGNSPSIFFTNPFVYLTYDKASWIFNQLNIILGKEVLLPVLRTLFQNYAYRSIDAAEFIQHFILELQDKHIDLDIAKYFDQWLFGAGHPIFHNNVVTIQDMTVTDKVVYSEVNVIITQEQLGDKIADAFEMPVWVSFYNGNQKVYTERVLINQKISEFTFYDIPGFTICRVDTTKTLCQNTQTITSINDINISNNLAVYPNPAVNQDYVFVNIDAAELDIDNISVTNILGVRQSVRTMLLSNGFQIVITDLPQGTYFIRYNNFVAKFSVIK